MLLTFVFKCILISSIVTYLVCTQMRVCRVEGSLPYLTSTCETETLITGYHKGQPYVNDPGVKSFIQWTKTLKDNVVLQKTAVGGHYCYPHPPQIYLRFKTFIELETLQYREHKKLAIQGQITAVRYMKNPKTTQSQPSGVVRNNILKRLAQSSHHSKCKVTSDYSLQVSTDVCEQAVPAPHNHPSANQNQGELMKLLLTWESSSWPKQQEDVSEHLCQGGLYQDSIYRRFTFDEKNVLLQWSNLQPTRWTAEQTADSIPPALCPGYYQVTILGKEILVTASELEDTHVVCVLDLCHLGGDEVEILISKVYRVTEVSLD
uniref:Uncharacterized protein n=1 Tax=Acanthochromis polyacanthus TaxID=80966 RepID=A0A3Q1G6L7_9TELE